MQKRGRGVYQRPPPFVLRRRRQGGRIGIECGHLSHGLRTRPYPEVLSQTACLGGSTMGYTTMIRRFIVLLGLAAALCAPGFAQEHEVSAKSKAATLMTGLGDWRHPVSTKNAQAQAFFDQGLRLIY